MREQHGHATSPSTATASEYVRHRPDETVLYETLQEHWKASSYRVLARWSGPSGGYVTRTQRSPSERPHKSQLTGHFARRSLEFEGSSATTWRYFTDGRPEMFTFIERYYNQTRLHSHNRYKTPERD